MTDTDRAILAHALRLQIQWLEDAGNHPEAVRPRELLQAIDECRCAIGADPGFVEHVSKMIEAAKDKIIEDASTDMDAFQVLVMVGAHQRLPDRYRDGLAAVATILKRRADIGAAWAAQDAIERAMGWRSGESAE